MDREKVIRYKIEKGSFRNGNLTFQISKGNEKKYLNFVDCKTFFDFGVVNSFISDFDENGLGIQNKFIIQKLNLLESEYSEYWLETINLDSKKELDITILSKECILSEKDIMNPISEEKF